MNEQDWDEVATTFDEAILDVTAHDRLGRIRKCVQRYGGKGRTAADIGCGVGRTLDLIANDFSTVFATDISQECLGMAHKAMAHHHHIQYIHSDLVQHHGLPYPVDLVVCINVVLHASLEKREAMLRHLCNGVKDGGHLLLVVPALESALYASHRLVRLNRHSGMSPKTAQRKALREMSDLDLGIVLVDGVPTKHHLKEELHDLLCAEGLQVRSTQKIEYPWSYVLEAPPEEMDGPTPWNWIVVAEKPVKRPGARNSRAAT
ncbi:MAG: class I SAM-dependent methyltransferase [Flavobacteriales bacterium]|nr:class I SAM-dependent methyltransferase [Flavobacteriales bacterium]